MDNTERPERLLSDADAAEILRRMEEDLKWALVKCVRIAVEDDEKEYKHKIVEVEIPNREQGEVVETIDTDGNPNTESEALYEVSQNYLERVSPCLRL